MAKSVRYPLDIALPTRQQLLGAATSLYGFPETDPNRGTLQTLVLIGAQLHLWTLSGQLTPLTLVPTLPYAVYGWELD